MKSAHDIDYIYTKLSNLYPHYANKKPKAKIYSKAYTSLIGVMLSAQSQDKRTAVACQQLFALADTPEEMIKLSQDEVIEAIRPAGLHNAKSKNILAISVRIILRIIDSLISSFNIFFFLIIKTFSTFHQFASFFQIFYINYF